MQQILSLAQIKMTSHCFFPQCSRYEMEEWAIHTVLSYNICLVNLWVTQQGSVVNYTSKHERTMNNDI